MSSSNGYGRCRPSSTGPPAPPSAVIVSVQTADVAAGHALTLGGAGGPVLQGLHLPYPLLEDI